MKFSLIFLLNLVFICSRNLLGIIDLFRHGARTPLTVDSLGFDILNLKWQQEKGDLTNIGLRQLYLSGARLRDRYAKDNKLFSEKFDKEEFIMMSTDVNRTILSAYSKLLGIFPGFDNSAILLNNTNYTIKMPQIVPVQVISYPSVLFQIDEKGVCKGFNEEFFADKDNNLLLKIDTIVKINYSVELFEKTLFPKLEPNLRLSRSDLHERLNDNPRFIYHLSDALLCAMTENIDISYLGLSTSNITFFRNYKDFFLLNGKRTDYHLKLMVVPLFDKIIEMSEHFLSKKYKLKYISYSSHDTNLVTLLRVFKLMINNMEDVVIPFASELIIEVFDDGNLNLIWNGQVLFEISINDFKSKRNNFLLSPKEFNDFCGFTTDDNINGNLFIFKIFVFFIVFDCFLLMILFIIFLTEKRKTRRRNIDSNFTEVMLVSDKLNNKV